MTVSRDPKENMSSGFVYKGVTQHNRLYFPVFGLEDCLSMGSFVLVYVYWVLQLERHLKVRRVSVEQVGIQHTSSKTINETTTTTTNLSPTPSRFKHFPFSGTLIRLESYARFVTQAMIQRFHDLQMNFHRVKQWKWPGAKFWLAEFEGFFSLSHVLM